MFFRAKSPTVVGEPKVSRVECSTLVSRRKLLKRKRRMPFIAFYAKWKCAKPFACMTPNVVLWMPALMCISSMEFINLNCVVASHCKYSSTSLCNLVFKLCSGNEITACRDKLHGYALESLTRLNRYNFARSCGFLFLEVHLSKFKQTARLNTDSIVGSIENARRKYSGARENGHVGSEKLSATLICMHEWS